MLIVAAMALAPRLSAAADCTLPAALQFGTATGDAGTGPVVDGCVKEADLADGKTCNLKAVPGYTFAANAVVGTYLCPTGDEVTPTTAMAATGCDVGYYQASGTVAASLVCTQCANGKTIAAALTKATVVTAAECAAATTTTTTTTKAATTTAKATGAAAAAAAAGVGVGAAASSAAVAFLLASFY